MLALANLQRSALSLAVAGIMLVPGISAAGTAAGTFCPDVYDQGTFRVPVNPTFMSIDKFAAPNGVDYDGLVVASFFNSIKNPDVNSNGVTSYFVRA